MALQPGARFGRYELVSRLGRGGMAETYRARLVGEAGVTKPVLIKKVLPEYANDDAFTTMFVSEARISASLSHGNIAQVYDFGRVDGEYFLAMEFVDGQPLHKILKRALRTGMTSINAVLAYAGIPTLPFGGVGDSGFGRIHGDEGMLEFVRAKATTSERFPMPGFGLSFGDPKKQLAQMRKTVDVLYAGSAIDDVTGVLRKIVRR